MFDLNTNDYNENTIFNNGIAGLVRNVEISIEKKNDDSNIPDYKLIAKDNLGTINTGFYYFKPNPQKTKEQNDKSEKQQVSRVVHLAKAVLGQDYVFPIFNTSKEIYDSLFNLVAQHSKGKKFNIFTTYGRTDNPSKYLSFRYFGFIESADNKETTLFVKANDLLERVVEDTPKVNNLDVNSMSTSPSSFSL